MGWSAELWHWMCETAGREKLSEKMNERYCINVVQYGEVV